METKLLIYLIKNFYGGTRITARTENGLVRQVENFNDKEKRRFRFFCTCLFLNKIVKQNYNIIRAYTTELEKKQNRSRSALRARYVREGKVKRHDGTHLHHKDGNPLNNKDSNIIILNGSKHKRHHRHLEADRNCHAALQSMLRILLQQKRTPIIKLIVKRLKTTLR